MPLARPLRTLLVAGIALVLCGPPARADESPHRTPAPPQSEIDAAPDLPVHDVLRLTEEARWIRGEVKLDPQGAGATRMRMAHPAAVQAESLHSYDAIHYRLDITPSRTSYLISGTMTLDLEVVDPAITQIDLHAVGLNVTAARVNGVARTFNVAGGQLFIPICEGGDCPPHGAGDPLQVAVDYSAATPQVGYYVYVRNSFTLSEPYDGRYWWPSYDLPSDKATLDMYVTVPSTEECLSNGVLVSVTPGAPGTNVYHWQETHPISTYLVSIAVGHFWHWTQMSGSIPILEAVWPEDSTKAKFDFANVPAMIPAFEARWGPYAFDKYGQVAVNPFPAGGMEHQSMTTINRSWVTGTRSAENGFAHELAHQWWGDMVTLVDFRNIWLNEGFASYGECEWREDFYGAAAYDTYIQSQMTSALNSDNNLRYALYDPPEANLFGNTIYKKGSLVLHMLRRVLGDAAFFAGMQLYGQRHKYGSASTEDFEQAMEDASGQPLDWYFDQWVYDKGLPTYHWGWSAFALPNPGQNRVRVQINQVQTNAPYFRMPIEFRVQRAGGLPDTFVTVTNNAGAQETVLLTVNGTVTGVVFDPRNSIYKRIQLITLDAPAPIPDPGPAVRLAASPNPARLSSRFNVQLSAPVSEAISLTIYDSAGRAVQVLGGRPEGGAATFDWDLRDRTGRRVPAGLYFARARVGANYEDRSLIVLE